MANNAGTDIKNLKGEYGSFTPTKSKETRVGIGLA